MRFEIYDPPIYPPSSTPVISTQTGCWSLSFNFFSYKIQISILAFRVICFVILQFDVFESLKLFLMREGFVFCSVLVVGVNTGTLVNLVLPDFDSPLLSAPPQTAHIYTHKFEYRNIFILLIIVIPSHARSARHPREASPIYITSTWMPWQALHLFSFGTCVIIYEN